MSTKPPQPPPAHKPGSTNPTSPPAPKPKYGATVICGDDRYRHKNHEPGEFYRLKKLAPPANKLRVGDKVTTRQKPLWKGTVCGTYSTLLVEDGCVVEASDVPGAVLCYPASQLEFTPEAPPSPHEGSRPIRDFFKRPLGKVGIHLTIFVLAYLLASCLPYFEEYPAKDRFTYFLVACLFSFAVCSLCVFWFGDPTEKK